MSPEGVTAVPPPPAPSAERNLVAAFRLLYRTFTPRLRMRLFAQIGLTILGAIAELATIGAVIPFLSLATRADTENSLGLFGQAIGRVSGLVGLSMIETAALILIFVAVVAGAVRLLLNWMIQEFAFSIAFELSTSLYGKVLDQPYIYHLNHNSAQFLSALAKIQFVTNMALLPAVQAFTSVFVSLCIVAALVVVDWQVALLTLVSFAAVYGTVTIVTRARLRANSRIIANAQTTRIKMIQESLGGIRDVILQRAQSLFLGMFAREDGRLRRTQAVNAFIAAAPRYVLEAGTVVFIAIVALVIAGRSGGLAAALPILGAFAIGAQRLLPLAQQVYSASAQIAGSQGSLNDILEMIEAPDTPQPAMRAELPEVQFRREIALRNLVYRYPGSDAAALKNVDLVIAKGARVGFVGPTGGGKSTLADVLMGLLTPTSGEMRVDGATLDGPATLGWQSHIAHVPQAIYLSDSSIAQNIAFGVPANQIDYSRVERAAERACIGQFVCDLPEGYATVVGENGIRLSGGQKQRIGIARALYQQADVLVLDEATSALDEQTEAAVMEAISQSGENVTVLIVAHRLSTLRMCNMIVRLERGEVSAVGDFATVIGDASEAPSA